GAGVLGGGGFEQGGAAARAVAHVIAREVGDDGGVAGVVFGDAGLDLAHQVGAHVGGLCVNAAAELGEKGHERGSEAEAHYEEGRLGRVAIRDQVGVRHVNEKNPEQRQRHDHEARDRAAAQGHGQGLAQGAASGGGGSQVGAHGHVHADVARDGGAGRTEQESDGGQYAERGLV